MKTLNRSTLLCAVSATARRFGHSGNIALLLSIVKMSDTHSPSNDLTSSPMTVVSWSACLGAEPTLGLVTRYYFLPEGCCLKVAVLFLWGALSDEKTGLQFT
jgi:hypothetical protein